MLQNACNPERMIEDGVCVHSSDRDQNFGLSGSFLASWRPELASSMGQFFDEPSYPVIDKAPGFWTTGDLAPEPWFCVLSAVL